MIESVGAVIRNKDGRYLLLDRVNIPHGWACPGGHVDNRETPEQAIKREVREETGLTVSALEHALEQDVSWNNCRWHKGHHHHVFVVTKWDGTVKISTREAKDWGWFAPEEIKKLSLEPVWKQWFEELKIL